MLRSSWISVPLAVISAIILDGRSYAQDHSHHSSVSMIGTSKDCRACHDDLSLQVQTRFGGAAGGGAAGPLSFQNGRPNFAVGWVIDDPNSSIRGLSVSGWTIVDASLGMALSPIDDTLRAQLDIAKDRGLAVVRVAEKSAASRAGLIKHDVIVTVDDRPVNSVEAFRDLVRAKAPKPAKLQFVRGGKSLSTEFTLDATAATIAQARSGIVARRAYSPGENGYRIGVSVATVDEAMKDQLNLPHDQGLVVDSSFPDGPAKKAGIEVNDVLLRVGGQNVACEPGLRAAIQKSEGKPIAIELLRHGKPMTIHVTPVKETKESAAGEVQLVGDGIVDLVVAQTDQSAALKAEESAALKAAAVFNKQEYFIGLPVEPLSDSLRSQLNLPESQGGLITGVPTADSPAESAGFKKNDILLKIDGAPLKTVEDLLKAVRDSEGKSLSVEILRGGKPQTLKVEPKKQPVAPQAPNGLQFRIVRPGVSNPPFEPVVVGRLLNNQPNPLINKPLNAQVGFQEETLLLRQLDLIRRQIEQLNKNVLELRDRVDHLGRKN